MPKCEADDNGVFCDGEGYSHSVEHGNQWLCRQHYSIFLKVKQVVNDNKDTLLKMDPVKLQQLLKGNK